jgi:hypothetical protein
MSRGGYREKAGRKSTWTSGCRFEDTKLIRVPAAIADKLLEIAHKIDDGEDIDSETKSLKNEVELLRSQAIAQSDVKQLELIESDDTSYSLDSLIQKGKQIILNESLVRIKDRGSVRKYFGLLLDVNRYLFK